MQLVRYLQAAGLPKGYMVIFDEKLATNPAVTEEGDQFELSMDEKILRIY